MIDGLCRKNLHFHDVHHENAARNGRRASRGTQGAAKMDESSPSEGEEGSIQVCKCGLSLSPRRPTFACHRCGVSWSLDVEMRSVARPIRRPTHSGSGSIH